MPIISMFYGIIIRMYLLDHRHHNLPHIHARHGEFFVPKEDLTSLAANAEAGLGVHMMGFALDHA